MSEVLREPELAQRQPYVWSVSRGLCTLDFKPVDKKTADPKQILPALLAFPKPALFVLQDFHFFLDERSPAAPLVIRQLRDLVPAFKAARKTLVLVSSVLKLPPELEKDVTVVDLDLPREEELLRLLEETLEQVQGNPKVDVRLGPGDRELIVKGLLGLTRSEAENALAKVIVETSRIDPDDVDLLLAEKEQIIRKSGTLEFYSTPERFGSIGGLDLLKQWLRQRGSAFSEAARAFGLPNPRGLLLVGVPGCGKSLSAKAVAAEWRMPLLRFDLGKVFQGYVGQSEENMRRALKMAEGVAPCLLWIDEIEKGLAGARGESSDSGTSQRVFGSLLTWMEEKSAPVFVIATANDISALPPELMRKGRFDEIFFIDLPNARERSQILAIHLTKHHRDYSEFDVAEHARNTEGFSGAELESVVIAALYEAFAEGEQTQLEDRHLAQAISQTVPQSRSLKEAIDQLRLLARGRWRPASGEETVDEAQPEAPLAEPPPVAVKRRRIFEV
ncbi:MAG: AAA family ATPase [Polyangiaceae bacterium]|nr:AAA family ATPase [Polyangiaceae bacterium]